MYSTNTFTWLQTFQVGPLQSNHECGIACPTWQLSEAFSFQDPEHKPLLYKVNLKSFRTFSVFNYCRSYVKTTTFICKEETIKIHFIISATEVNNQSCETVLKRLITINVCSKWAICPWHLFWHSLHVQNFAKINSRLWKQCSKKQNLGPRIMLVLVTSIWSWDFIIPFV